MRFQVRRAALLAVIMLGLAGCEVTDADIEHWKHTQRGPRKITTVLVDGQYPQNLRVHAARALIEMKHPNANGLDLLQAALTTATQSDREAIVHALLPELSRMMVGPTGAGSAAAAQGPTETQIRAKDAAFVLLRGDGHASFANSEDRAALSTALLDWILVDFNTRALAGSFTAEQIVTVIGPTAVDRLTQAIAFTKEAIPVVVEIAKLINSVGTPQGKTAAVDRIVAVSREVESPAATDRLRGTARELLTSGGREATEPRVNSAAEQLRGQYLLVLFEAIKTLGQPNGTQYLISVASSPDAAVPIERRKAALAAITNQVSSANVEPLLALANCTPGPTCDIELRGYAIDRLGETRDRNVVPRLYQIYDGSHGGAADQSFTLRWKAGEAVLRLTGPEGIAAFMQHLAAPRPAPFAGYTFAEINGEAQAIGDMSPPPRDAMRGYVTVGNAVPVRLLAISFLGIKGEERDLALLASIGADTTPVTGEGWSDLQLGTLGAVARRARDGLQQTLRQQSQQNQAAGGAAPTAPTP